MILLFSLPVKTTNSYPRVFKGVRHGTRRAATVRPGFQPFYHDLKVKLHFNLKYLCDTVDFKGKKSRIDDLMGGGRGISLILM